VDERRRFQKANRNSKRKMQITLHLTRTNIAKSNYKLVSGTGLRF